MPTLKNFIIAIVGFILILLAMHIEYRVIMTNIKPYHGENNTVYLEVFGNVDEYECEHISGMER